MTCIARTSIGSSLRVPYQRLKSRSFRLSCSITQGESSILPLGFGSRIAISYTQISKVTWLAPPPRLFGCCSLHQKVNPNVLAPPKVDACWLSLPLLNLFAVHHGRWARSDSRRAISSVSSRALREAHIHGPPLHKVREDQRA